MSDEVALLLVLAALHVMESCQIVPHGAVVFHSTWWGRHAARFASSLLRVSRGRFLFLNPLDVRAHAYVSGLPHILPTADGVFDVSPEEDNAPRRRPFVPWTAIGPALAAESDVRCPGLGILPCGSPGNARLWARALNAIRTAAPARRTRVADRWIRLRFSAAIARRRIARVDRACRPLVGITTAGFALVVAGSVVITQRVSELLLIGFLGTGVLTGSAIAIAYAVAHARLERGAWPTWLGRALLMAACFPVAWRARSRLGRDALGPAHPAAAAAVLLPPEHARPVLSLLLRRWKHPAPAPRPGSPEATRFSQAAELVHAQIRSLARTLEIDPVALEAPPSLSDPAVRAWCPRCHATYVHSAGTCADCRDVPLVAVSRP